MNFIDIEEEHSSFRLNHQPLEVLWASLQLFQQSQDVLIPLTNLFFANQSLCPLPGNFESLTIEWLQQVIERMHFKGAHSVLVIRCGKDYVRDVVALE